MRSVTSWRRCVSELVGVAVLIGVVVASFASFSTYYMTTLGSVQPRLRNFRAYIAQTEVIVNNTLIREPTRNFTANYLYRVVFVIHNAGTEEITSISYSVISLRSNVVSVGTSDTNDVLDPLVVSGVPPASLKPNAILTFTLVVFSKKNLLSPDFSVLALRIVGTYGDGAIQEFLLVFPR